MSKKTLLITGGAGFIGSNFILYFLEKYPDYFIINLDKLTYAGDLNNLANVSSNPNYKFIHGNITNPDLVSYLFKQYKISDVIHFAAESHVDNSIAGPEVFFQTNVMGTYNLINTAKNFWMNSVNNYKPEYKNSRFHHISTDEVYGTLGETGCFTETTPYAPNSPYSASKASSDFVVRSYFHTYGLNIVTTNCSNNYGPRQHSEKLIPVIINKAINNQPIPIYGNGKNIRDWLFVEDHCSAIDTVFHHGLTGETYNIGGNCEKTNLEVVETICTILDNKVPNSNKIKYSDLITFVSDRPGHDQRYAIDATKIQTELGWSPQTNFTDGIIKTISWYI
ncbi:MAG: dTDP-glucose 4,6-dehydratase [Gammaproteobacteria bacterium]|nr:dTDP-glucose 4,6-dehydratase [Gammaproteobacteria bacterium]